jgi:hypothetical protein
MVIGLSFMTSLQLVFLGILGEYIGAIHTQQQRRPYAIERERVNFDFDPDAPPAIGCHPVPGANAAPHLLDGQDHPG